MEFRHIQSFVQLARHGSFSRAAAALGVAQPALSQRIRQLEDEFGVRLVDRASRPPRLTEAGVAFLGRAERILAEADLASGEMMALSGTRATKVVVGALPALASMWLPTILGRFQAENPGVHITVREGNTEELARLLATGQLDLALLHEVPDLYPGTGRYPGIRTVRLFDEELLVIAAPGSRVASHSWVSLDMLRDESWVFVAHGSGLAHSVSSAMSAAGFEPRVTVACDTQVTLRALVSAGIGISIAARIPAENSFPPLAAIPLRPALPAHTTVVAWRSDSRPVAAAQDLIDAIRGHGPDSSDPGSVR